MRRFVPLMSSFALAGSSFFLATSALQAQSPNIHVIDDFENGVGAWVRNDKPRGDALPTNPDADVTLVDITATQPNSGLPFLSKGAALLSFKSAASSWASVSLRVKGADWTKVGAKNLTFWLDAPGEVQGTDLVLRSSTKGANGKIVEESFVMPIRLNVRQWRKVSIPLAQIKNDKGVTLLSRLSNVYLLQFTQRGTWNSRFFTVDQLQVEGSGTPLPGATPTPTPAPQPTATPTPTPLPPDTTQVDVDFLKDTGRISTSANISVGANLSPVDGSRRLPLLESESFRNAIKVLGPHMVRLDAATFVEMTDSSKPSFDFSRLVAAVRQVRALGAEPLVALSNDPSWGLGPDGFSQFAAQAARAVTAKEAAPSPAVATKLPIRFEIAAISGSPFAPALADAEAVALYNRARAAVKKVLPKAQVGGFSAPSSRAATLAALLKGAQGLDFLTLQFYATNSENAQNEVLFAGARNLGSVRAAAVTLDKSRFRNAPIYITQSNLSAVRDLNTGNDSRVAQMASGAWWLTYLGTSSRLADQVFHNDAANPEWGLLNEENLAYPAYLAMWMWNTYAPRGSDPVQVKVTGKNIAAFAVNASVAGAKPGEPRAHNVLLANTRNENTTVRIAIRGFAKLRYVSLRVLDDPKIGVRPATEQPKSAFQTITLKPYSVVAVQFIEPAKS